MTIDDAALAESDLIRRAKNPELKDLLSTGLKIFEDHQEHAAMLVDELK
jgi:predicted outer membrane protein